MNLFKRATTRVALGVLATGALALAAPVAAHAATITGAGTSITFSGTGDDYITQDQAWSYDPSNSTINATASTDGNSVGVNITGDTTWTLDFAAPQGQADVFEHGAAPERFREVAEGDRGCDRALPRSPGGRRGSR